ERHRAHDQGHRERCSTGNHGAGAPAAVGRAAPRPRADRHARRLRARRLRGVHGAGGRRSGAVVPDARRPGGRSLGDDGRRAGP
ncbi:MAG: Aerobic carbon monoxide dehydrogenase (quinone), small chain, partial [uncultured Blastococcus sp.]